MAAPLSLKRALRAALDNRLAIVGAGGKSALMFNLARDFTSAVIATTSTHLAEEQAGLADEHYTITSIDQIYEILQRPLQGVILFTGLKTADGWLSGLPMDWSARLSQEAERRHIPVIIEADGSRRLPLKAPAAHEPSIPTWARQVAVVAGLSGLNQPLDSAHVHRPEMFAQLSGLDIGSPVTIEGLTRVLLSHQGGLKNIQPGMRRTAVLNQADDELLSSTAGKMAEALLSGYDEVVVTRLIDPASPVKAVYTRVAGIILAAGGSSRLQGGTKVLLDWQGEPFVRKIARTALRAGLNPVVVVTGAEAGQVEAALQGLEVILVHNSRWQEGQSSSLQAGIRMLPGSAGGAVFLLSDMPQVDERLLKALVEEYRSTLGPIIAPMVEDRRANPVLFDRETFARIQELTGDTGGRAVFSHFPVVYLPWQDPLLLMDVDTSEDYQRLREAYAARNSRQ